MNLEQFDRHMAERGWATFPDVVERDLLLGLRNEALERERECRALQEHAGLQRRANGSAHHVLRGGGPCETFLERLYLREYISHYFDGPYILNSFGASINRKTDDGSYLRRIHRDVRTYSGSFPILLNMLVMVDDFTADNGATVVLPGSHRQHQQPEDSVFSAGAVELTARAGTVVLFDSNLWYAAGASHTEESRVGLTLTFSRPFVKPQLDYVRFLGPRYVEGLNDDLRQVLGWYARVPASYEEWYQPQQSRYYRSEQG